MKVWRRRPDRQRDQLLARKVLDAEAVLYPAWSDPNNLEQRQNNDTSAAICCIIAEQHAS
jgi:hypothetical protein